VAFSLAHHHLKKFAPQPQRLLFQVLNIQFYVPYI